MSLMMRTQPWQPRACSLRTMSSLGQTSMSPPGECGACRSGMSALMKQLVQLELTATPFVCAAASTSTSSLASTLVSTRRSRLTSDPCMSVFSDGS